MLAQNRIERKTNGGRSTNADDGDNVGDPIASFRKHQADFSEEWFLCPIISGSLLRA